MSRSITALAAGALLAVSLSAVAAPGAIEGIEKQPVNVSAIAMFMIFVLATLGITKWAAGKTKTTADFYTAGGGISGFQNGLAIAAAVMIASDPTIVETMTTRSRVLVVCDCRVSGLQCESVRFIV